MNPSPSSLSALIEKQFGEELGDTLERVIAGVATSEESDAVWTLRKNLPTLLALSRWALTARESLEVVKMSDIAELSRSEAADSLARFPLPHVQ